MLGSDSRKPICIKRRTTRTCSLFLITANFLNLSSTNWFFPFGPLQSGYQSIEYFFPFASFHFRLASYPMAPKANDRLLFWKMSLFDFVLKTKKPWVPGKPSSPDGAPRRLCDCSTKIDRTKAGHPCFIRWSDKGEQRWKVFPANTSCYFNEPLIGHDIAFPIWQAQFFIVAAFFLCLTYLPTYYYVGGPVPRQSFSEWHHRTLCWKGSGLLIICMFAEQTACFTKWGVINQRNRGKI